MADFSIAATARKSQATANGSTTQFAFAFSVNVEGDIAVYVNTTLKTISTHYTVSITANTGAGSITFTSGNTPSNGQIVTIMSKTALARTSVYTAGGTISASALESDFDTNMMLFGQLQEQIDRTIKFPVQDATSLTSTLPIGTSRAGFLTFDASGNVTIDTLPAGDLLLETDDGAILSLTSTDTTITADSVLGAINFSAPSEASGTDAILTGAAIEAVAEGTFAADSNATKLVFKTGASEAASTKMTLTSAGNLTVTGALTAGSLVIGSADIAEVEFEMIDGITAGTVAASKAVVVDANKDISSFRNLTATGAITGGSLVIGSADIAETELEMLDGITAGTVAASKALVVDSNKKLNELLVDNLQLNSSTLSSTDSNGHIYITPNGSGNIYAQTDTFQIKASNGEDAYLVLSADDSDDNGDDWVIKHESSDNTLLIRTDISGSDVTHLTLTPHATAASSTATFAGKITAGNDITATGSFIIGSASMNETDLEKIDGIVNGQGAANKALVLDASSDIENIRNVTATGFFKIGNASMDETDLEKLDGITNGTVEASKALVVDSNKKLNELLVDHLSLDSRTLSSTESNGHLYITPNGTGNLFVNTDTLHILAADGEYARIQLSADNSDDSGDDWIIQSNTSNTFQIGNDISGSAVAHLTITPHATVASSIAAFAGKITAGNDITTSGSFIIGSASINENDLESIDGITAGTVAASKALVVDSNKKLNELLVDNITIDGNTLSSTDSNGHIHITPNGSGNVYVNTDTVQIKAANGEKALLVLSADNSDDPGDDWLLQADFNQKLYIANDISGSDIAHVTLTPNATVANSTAAFAGHVTVGHDLTVDGGGSFTQAGGGLKVLNNGTAGYNANIFFGISNQTDGWSIGQGITANDGVFRLYDNGGAGVKMSATSGGDISFYEDTGSTAKFFWDASAERLGLGTSSPSVEVSIAGSDPQLCLWEGNDGASSSKVQLGTGTAQGFINVHKGDGTRTVQINSDGDSYFNGGNLLVGGVNTSPATNNVAGSSHGSLGNIQASVDGNPCLFVNRKSNDGDIISFRKDGSAVGSIGVDNTDNLTISGNSSHCGLNFSTDDINPYKNGAYTNGTTSLGSGSTRFKDLFLSGGVYLGGTGSANLLSDYEEGTFSATDTSGATLTMADAAAKYTKIGRLVNVTLVITWPAGSNGNNATIGTLPFTVFNNTVNSTSGSVYCNLAGTQVLAQHNTTDLRFYNSGGNSVTNANLAEKSVRVNVSYYTS